MSNLTRSPAATNGSHPPPTTNLPPLRSGSSSEAATPQPWKAGVVAVRQIYVTHFELKMPEGQSYLEPGAYKLIKAENEPLAQFLADAEVSRGGGAQKRDAKVSYFFGTTPVTAWRPMQFVTPGILEAFEKAAREFYAKAHADQNVPAFQRQLRAGFRLPDPDLEPEAYWLVGDRFNPKLVVLWGCEKLDGNNRLLPTLPMVKDTELFRGNPVTVADKLRARLIKWETILQENLELITERQEPIGRFLARPVYDAKQEQLIGLRSVLNADRVFPIGKFKPLRKIPTREIAAFESAAEGFYAKARPNEEADSELPEVSAYERELRGNFRLPDVDTAATRNKGASGQDALTLLEEVKPKSKSKKASAKPTRQGAYWVYGRRFSRHLMIAVEGDEPIDRCLCLCPDEELGLPPATTQDGRGGGKEPPGLDFDLAPSTVVGKLRAREQTVIATTIRMVAAAAVIALLTFLYFHFFYVQLEPLSAGVSNDPKIDPANSRNIIAIVFNTTVKPESVKVSGPTTKDRLQSFLLEPTDPADAPAGLRITKVQPSKDDPKEFLITVSGPVLDGAKYRLAINGLEPTFGRPMKKGTAILVDTIDRRPPALLSVESAIDSTKKLLVKFDEKLDPEIRNHPEDFMVQGNPGVTVESVDLDDANNTAILTATPAFVISNFYKLTVRGVKDAAQRGNANPEQTKSFIYGDHPPMLVANGISGGLKGQHTQHTIYVRFTKEVDEASAVNPANYEVGPNLVIGSIALQTNKTEVAITLTNSWMDQKTTYALHFRNLKDPLGNAGEGQGTFTYQGDLDLTGPTLRGNPEALSRNQIRLIFSKPVTGAAMYDTNQFELAQSREDGTSRSLGHPTRIDHPKADTVLLTFATSLNKQKYYVLGWRNIRDDVGNVTPNNVSEKFPGSHLVRMPKLYIQERRGSTLDFTAVSYDNGFDPESFVTARFNVTVTDLATGQSRRYASKDLATDFENKRTDEAGREDRYDSQFALVLNGVLPERITVHVEWAASVDRSPETLAADFSPN